MALVCRSNYRQPLEQLRHGKRNSTVLGHTYGSLTSFSSGRTTTMLPWPVHHSWRCWSSCSCRISSICTSGDFFSRRTSRGSANSSRARHCSTWGRAALDALPRVCKQLCSFLWSMVAITGHVYFFHCLHACVASTLQMTDTGR